MSTRKNGGPAFPVPASESLPAVDGMTLRDYFAAKSLAGMASQYHEHWTEQRIAECAYELADAMLKERAK